MAEPKFGDPHKLLPQEGREGPIKEECPRCGGQVNTSTS